MSGEAVDVAELLALARDRSRNARSRLVSNITDLFLGDAERLTDQERALMSDILCKLIGSIEKSLRRQLANAIAHTDMDLPDLARLLASDDIEIARPVLEESPLLRNTDLIEVIRMRTDEHRMAIAVRRHLDEEVTDALIEYGNEDVIALLLQNDDAALSETAMEYLAAESRSRDEFQEPLISRSDLPPALAYKMYWWVSAALRQKILADFKIEEDFLDEVIRRATETAMVSDEGTESVLRQARKLASGLHERGELKTSTLLMALRQQRIPLFVACMAELSELDYRTTWQMITDPGGESLAVLARQVGLERNEFASCCLLLLQARHKNLPQAPAKLHNLLAVFDALRPDVAEKVMRYWRQDESYRQAIELLSENR